MRARRYETFGQHICCSGRHAGGSPEQAWKARQENAPLVLEHGRGCMQSVRSAALPVPINVWSWEKISSAAEMLRSNGWRSVATRRYDAGMVAPGAGVVALKRHLSHVVTVLLAALATALYAIRCWSDTRVATSGSSGSSGSAPALWTLALAGDSDCTIAIHVRTALLSDAQRARY